MTQRMAECKSNSRMSVVTPIIIRLRYHDTILKVLACPMFNTFFQSIDLLQSITKKNKRKFSKRENQQPQVLL